MNIKRKTEELDSIIIRGAREHNLKNIDVDLPKKKLIVFTGVSGSGKSSLAFDTIFAEGQRRYIESLSAYARQFIGQIEKPKFETIRGLSPTISIEQKAASKNPRSTVGTITEIYDYLRVLFARMGIQYCYKCGKKVGKGNAETMVNQILKLPESTKFMLLSPIIENRKGEHKERLDILRQEGFSRVRVDGVVQSLENVQSLAKNKKHSVEVVVDRLKIKSDHVFKKRLIDSVETSLKEGKGQIILHIEGQEDRKMSEARSCCGIAYPELGPPLFSFNAPQGMCEECNGIGSILSMDIDKLIPDKSLSIREGAIIPWKNYFDPTNRREGSWGLQQFNAIEEQWGIDFTTPWKRLPEKHQELLLFGSQGQEMQVALSSGKIQGKISTAFEGVMVTMMRRYKQTQSDSAKKYYSKFLSEKVCYRCQGKRLKEETLHVRVHDKSIIDITGMTIGEAHQFFNGLKLEGNEKLIGNELLKEIGNRLGFLVNVGLNYLTLDRKGPTLSGGESQRIRLASQIGSELTGVLYVLDEPSIGLHQRDNMKLLQSLCHLRDIGNTLIIVEHDQETMEAADWILDIGPGAGVTGGQIVAEGTPEQISNNPLSPTGKFLSGKEKIEITTRKKIPSKTGKQWIRIKKAEENNLKNIDVSIPLGVFVAITGVSGAGKSTLINRILYPELSRALHASTVEVGKHGGITGLFNLDKIINIDQKPIGRTPRSNPATYTKVFDLIRNLFSTLPESKARGYKKGRFSFNVKGGRCEACSGDGYNKIEMHFLADVFVPCETCGGKRFNSSTLEILFKGHSIADILDLSIREAVGLFRNQPKIRNILQTLIDVGLTYIKLGQAATTLSGGEAQRIKLARELAKRDTGRTLYLLDEPTTGLHFQDIRLLLNVLRRLVAGNNSILVIEHNLDVIKTADWIIDLGPEGGSEGGKIIAQGTPEEIAENTASYTGQYLKKILQDKI
jgi:excinuclease ABC subunit A